MKAGKRYIVFDFRYRTVKRVLVKDITLRDFRELSVLCENEGEGTFTCEYLSTTFMDINKNYMCDCTTCFSKDDLAITSRVMKKRFKELYGRSAYDHIGRYREMLEELKKL